MNEKPYNGTPPPEGEGVAASKDGGRRAGSWLPAAGQRTPGTRTDTRRHK